VKRATMSHRLLAGVTGLALGLGSALALAAPAQATTEPPSVIEPTFGDTCDGTYVTLTNDEAMHDWTVTAGGEVVWDGELGKFDSEVVFVPSDAGEIEVDYGVESEGWPWTWEEPEWCADLPEPTYTQPTCEEPGEIVIPAIPEFAKVQATDRTAAAVTAQQAPTLFYTLNDEQVEPESTHTVEAGTHVVALNVEITYYFSDSPLTVEHVLKTWIIELEEPECEGEGGELPETGTSTALIAGGALLLLTLGAAMYFVARRRRITFTT
jgi:LPXTG-motif cell wall-anchored protein